VCRNERKAGFRNIENLQYVGVCTDLGDLLASAMPTKITDAFLTEDCDPRWDPPELNPGRCGEVLPAFCAVEVSCTRSRIAFHCRGGA
jgi:hypothetical protein